MHVLGLPPAFVLSQDQTLKLNENFSPDWSLSLDESQAHLSHRLTTIRSMVYLENVTVRVSHRPHLRKKMAVRKDLRRPRFSFFRFNCQTANSIQRQPKAKTNRRLFVPTGQPGGCCHSFRRRSDARPPQSCRSDAVDGWCIRLPLSGVNTNFSFLRKTPVSSKRSL